MLNPSSAFEGQFAYIKSVVANMNASHFLAERVVGRYWADDHIFCWQDALFKHSAEKVRKDFRWIVQEYLSGQPLGDYSQFEKYTEEQLLKEPFISYYLKYCSPVPEIYHTCEPLFDSAKQWGVRFRGKNISMNNMRHQRYITNFYLFGLFDYAQYIAREQGNFVVCEIGAGYGMLAKHMLDYLPEKTKYIIVDFPSLLGLSATYLSILFPQRRMVMLDPLKNGPFYLDKIIEDYDIIFIPNTAYQCLAKLKHLNFAINTLSFQEMTQQEIRNYCSVISDRLEGFFYSDNMWRHPYNYALTGKVSDILAEYFYVWPHDKPLNKVQHTRHSMWQNYTHFCTSKKSPIFFNMEGITFHGENYTMTSKNNELHIEIV